jgi:hypothetical protein
MRERKSIQDVLERIQLGCVVQFVVKESVNAKAKAAAGSR